MPSTHELFRVVTTEAAGAPVVALATVVLPIAPDPFVPELSTFWKLRIVIELAAAYESVAFTLAFVNPEAEKALQISAVPGWEFDLLTSVQLSPAPETAVIWLPEPDGPSAAINANNSSLPADEVNMGEEIVELEAELSAHVCTSTFNAAVAVVLCPAKLTPVAFAPFTDTAALAGVNE